MLPVLSDVFSRSPPLILYHYTSLAGLQGIAQERSIRASNIVFMNDATELTHVASFIEEHIRSNKLEGEVVSQFVIWLRNRLQIGPLVHAACFTEQGNLLSQWRGYCEYGTGVSLGLSASDLASSAMAAGFKLGKCIYEAAEKRRIAGRIVEVVLQTASQMGPAPVTKAHPSQSYHPAFMTLELDLFQIAALFKHPHFKEEQEWRLISTPTNDYGNAPILFRPGKYTFIPYMQVPLPVSDDRVVFPEVIMGPTRDPRLSFESLCMFLAKNAHYERLTNSMSPLRT